MLDRISSKDKENQRGSEKQRLPKLKKSASQIKFNHQLNGGKFTKTQSFSVLGLNHSQENLLVTNDIARNANLQLAYKSA